MWLELASFTEFAPKRNGVKREENQEDGFEMLARATRAQLSILPVTMARTRAEGEHVALPKSRIVSGGTRRVAALSGKLNSLAPRLAQHCIGSRDGNSGAHEYTSYALLLVSSKHPRAGSLCSPTQPVPLGLGYRSLLFFLSTCFAPSQTK